MNMREFFRKDRFSSSPRYDALLKDELRHREVRKRCILEEHGGTLVDSPDAARFYDVAADCYYNYASDAELYAALDRLKLNKMRGFQ